MVGTALDLNLTSTDRKRLIKVFANRYGPNFDISCVKSDLKDKLKMTTDTYPIVNIEMVRFEYYSYSSFKFTCMCC